MKRKGQSTLEYVVVLTAIVAIILATVMTTIGNKVETAGLGKLFKNVQTKIENSTKKVTTDLKL